MKNNSSASNEIFRMDPKTLRQRAARTQTAQGDHNDFLMQWGRKVPNLMNEGEDTFVALSSYTGLDKGITNVKGIGLSSKGQPVPKAIRNNVQVFEDSLEKVMFGNDATGAPGLEPGEDKTLRLGSCVSESKRRRDGIALAISLGLSSEEAEALANAFLRPDSSYWGVKIYRRNVQTSSTIEQKNFAAMDDCEDLSDLFV